jgi:hypothetical protein
MDRGRSSSVSSIKDETHQSLKQKRCCCCLSLQKGITALIYYDLFQLVSQMILFLVILQDELADSESLNLFRGRHFIWWFYSSGLFSILLGIKAYYGSKFIWYSTDGYQRRLFNNNLRKTEKQ